VQQLPLRREDPPDDALIIIRAGIMERDAVVRSATQCFEGYGVHGISVEAAVDERVDSACANSPPLRRYRHVRLSTVGRLHEAGFAFLPSFEHPHFTVVLPDVSELTLRRLDRTFDPAIPNPGRTQDG
jgi:hypothetical protein